MLDEHHAVGISYQMVRAYVAARREEIRLQAGKGVRGGPVQRGQLRPLLLPPRRLGLMQERRSTEIGRAPLVVEFEGAFRDDAEFIALRVRHHQEPAIGVLLQPASTERLNPLLFGGGVG